MSANDDASASGGADDVFEDGRDGTNDVDDEVLVECVVQAPQNVDVRPKIRKRS